MTTVDWLIRLLIIGILGVTWFWYVQGWRRWRQVDAQLASPQRLAALAFSTLCILAAFFPPLDLASRHWLFARAFQKVALAFWAAPFFWLAAPFHLGSRGLSFEGRQRLTRWLATERWSGRLARGIGHPALAWFTFVAAIILWNDAAVVDWTMPRQGLHGLMMLVLLGIALLYWQQLVGTGPRLRRQLPGWVLFVYVLGVEVPNMATGMTIAYAGAPFYSYYTAMHSLSAASFGVIEDQMMSGGLIWFTGSFVFFGSAVLIVNRLFHHHGGHSPHHHPDWDSDERMIAPGLEHRLKEKP